MLKHAPKALLWLALASPLAWLIWQVAIEIQAPTTALGADPGEAIVHFLGEWAIRILLLAFSVTPVFHLTRLVWIASARRLVGLWAFTYVVLHLLAYLFFYIEFSWSAAMEDVVKRSYITAGFLAFVCLIPMALTSTAAMRRRLGKTWRQIHQLVYVALAAGLVHLFWLTRDGYTEVVVYLAWFILLVGYRRYKVKLKR